VPQELAGGFFEQPYCEFVVQGYYTYRAAAVYKRIGTLYSRLKVLHTQTRRPRSNGEEEEEERV